MRRFKLIMTTALGALAISAIAASGAQADAYSCTFTGAAGPVTAYDNVGEVAQEDGVENHVADAQNNELDGTPVGNVLNDTDDGDGSAEIGGQDGFYEFATAPNGATCAYVETGGNPGRVSGVYPATIASNGEYNNIVCSTGQAIDNDVGDHGAEVTSVTFANPVLAANITDADFRIDFSAGAGVLDIRDADNADGESGSGAAVDGAVDIEPTTGNCVNSDVTAFAVAGSFSGMTS